MKNFLLGAASGAMLTTGSLAIGMHLFSGETRRIPQFENSSAKVWRTVVKPGQPTALHRHDHPRVIVALTDGTMDLVDANGQHEQHAWRAGHAYWLPAMAPNKMHQDVNSGDAPLDVMVVELQREQ